MLSKWMEDLERGDPQQRRAAAQGLLEMGSEASPAAIFLLRACGDDDEEIRELASGALEDLGPPPLTALASLREAL
jgi:HEAT repeat protein